jgi:glutaredoxin-like protein NrdH
MKVVKMTVEVYSKPNCVQCTQTKKTLDKQGVEYVTIDLTADAEAFEFVTSELKHRAAPVVVVKDDKGSVVKSWAGFQPELLSELK